MATASEGKVQEALVEFLKHHSLNDSVGDVDDIVLQYVISILEDLGNSQNAEENIDVDQFVDVMDAYIPGFKELDSVEVCEWMFELASSLTKTDCKQEFQTIEDPSISPFEDHIGLTASGYQQKRDHLDSQGDSERSTSESSQDDVDEQLQILIEMFPESLKMELEHCLHSAEGDVDRTVQLIFHRQETGIAITEESMNKTKIKKERGVIPTQSKEEKEKLIERYAFIDVDDDKKTHRPPPPKTEPKKMIRYLDGQVVNTKGQKYTEIKRREDEEEMKKTYVNLKPARKYRFH